MERAEQLIEKLRIQLRNGESRERLLTTLGILYAEIHGDVSGQSGFERKGTVAVILPVPQAMSVTEATGSHPEKEERLVQPLEVDEVELEAELLAIRRAAEFRNASALNQRESVTPPPSLEDSAPRPASTQVHSDPSPSLNERLGAREREVSERLAEEPVHDLRKAVSLNDRFRFVNELFKGDHNLYDAAIEVLNGSPDLEHAMVWVRTEGFGRMGWKEDEDLCVQFVGLVRRRFL